MSNLDNYWNYFLTSYASKELSYTFTSGFLVALVYLFVLILVLAIVALFIDILQLRVMKKNKATKFLINKKIRAVCADVVLLCGSFIVSINVFSIDKIKEKYQTIFYPSELMEYDFKKFNLSAEEVISVMKVMEEAKSSKDKYYYKAIENKVSQ